MSFPSDKVTFPDPHTNLGTSLEESGVALVPEVRLHEAGFRDVAGNWEFADVRSPFWRLYRNERNGSRIICGGQSYPLRPGRFVLIPEMAHFSTRGDFSHGHLWLHFSLIPSINVTTRPIILESNALTTETAVALTKALRKKSSAPGELRHLAAALVHLSLSRVQLEGGCIPVPVAKLMRLVAEHPEQPWNNADMARTAGVGEARLVRLFQTATKKSPREYLREVRLRRAMRMLALTDDSLEMIADTCGFPNRHYMTRVFTRSMGRPPAAYRNEIRAEGGSLQEFPDRGH